MKFLEEKLMLGSSNNLNHVPGYISSQKKLVAKILQVGAGGVIAGFTPVLAARLLTKLESNISISVVKRWYLLTNSVFN